MSNSKFDYTVIEDNGGGLHLFVFKTAESRPFVWFSGFEYHKPGVLVACLDALDEGDDTRTWEGAEDASEAWNFVITAQHGFDWVCTGGPDGRVIHPDRMGVAAAREFGFKEEEEEE